MRKQGRRPGPNTTRAALLAAARQRFAETGYDGTSLRTIAADAAVDPAVVMHFFGSKDALFRAAVGWPFDPTPLAARIASPDEEEIGARIARAFLDMWEDPTIRAPLLALLRSAMSQPTSATLLREFVVHQVFGRLSGLMDGPQVELRINLAASQMIGVAVLRYILQFEPIASASTDELVTWLTPALTHYLAPEH